MKQGKKHKMKTVTINQVLLFSRGHALWQVYEEHRNMGKKIAVNGTFKFFNKLNI